MISSNEFRNGVTIELDGNIYQVIEFQHVKPGKGSAFVRTKLRNVRTGSVLDKTFNAGEKVSRAHVESKEAQYLYNDGNLYTFMDTTTFEQFAVSREVLGDALNFLKDNMTINVDLYQGEIIGVAVPNSVVLSVSETEPGVKGDTAAGGTKPAKLETGFVVRVPLFINPGDQLIIDTRTGAYISRA